MAFSPLHAAAHYGHTEAARALLTAGADANAKVYNDTPLGMALAKGRIEVIQTLANGGADLN